MPSAEHAAPTRGAASDLEAGADVWHALRVSVKASARDPSLLIVRRLEDGKPPPPGTRLALIVVDPKAELFPGTAGEHKNG